MLRAFLSNIYSKIQWEASGIHTSLPVCVLRLSRSSKICAKDKGQVIAPICRGPSLQIRLQLDALH